MRDFSDDLAALRSRLDEAAGYLRIDELRSRRPQLETEASRPDLAIVKRFCGLSGLRGHLAGCAVRRYPMRAEHPVRLVVPAVVKHAFGQPFICHVLDEASEKGLRRIGRND